MSPQQRQRSRHQIRMGGQHCKVLYRKRERVEQMINTRYHHDTLVHGDDSEWLLRTQCDERWTNRHESLAIIRRSYKPLRRKIDNNNNNGEPTNDVNICHNMISYQLWYRNQLLEHVGPIYTYLSNMEDRCRWFANANCINNKVSIMSTSTSTNSKLTKFISFSVQFSI